MRIVILSVKNQITIPKALLQQLQVAPKSKLLIKAENDVILARPLKQSVFDELAGSLTKYVHPSKLGVPFDVIMEETKKIVAKKLAA